MRGDVHARALAVHVRNCEISHWSCWGRSPGAAGVPTMTYHWALQWVPNIECLKLSEIILRVLQDDIPDEEIDHVAGLQSRVLYLDSRVFSLPQVPPFAPHNHCEFFVEGPEVTPQDFSALLPNLRSLTCSFLLLAYLAPVVPCEPYSYRRRTTFLSDLGAILGSHRLNTIANLPSHRQYISQWPMATAKLMTVGQLITSHATSVQWAVSLTTQQLHISVSARFPLTDLALQHTMLCGALSQNEWERSAVDEHGGKVIALFKARDPCVVDYDGCLQRLSA
ncbi:hypothetical protein BD779DRAFT_1518199 [Infundibulicybe gibba]|nr:hypothetical protein BD779DRAFT_1518199 [Infundibulicybe gibba]